jgi:putative CocE/NonD family hydrolase
MSAAANSYPVRTIRLQWIAVRDGTRLAARLWLPEGLAHERFPVVLEYIPYRTFDRYRAIDDRWGTTLASRGISFARVDIRGSGNSEGLLRDEYLLSEQEDGADVIAWLAAQPWCNGNVGMRGISWGGFSALQVAALRPPALKAIMPMCATDSRFRNDAHYVGGVPGLTNLKWAAGFELVMSGPPDPAIVGARWEKMWRERLEATPSIAARWLVHDWNDDYWRHGSPGLAPAQVECPTYLVGGWSDSYAESIERLLRSLTTATQAIIGPWGHTYPDLAWPAPGLDWATEEVRWWKRWLGDPSQDAQADPKFRFYLSEATPSQAGTSGIPGRWVAETSWPSKDLRENVLFLAPGKLAPERSTQRVTYVRDKIVGLATPEWIPYARAELPRDQSDDDARSLVFDCPISETTEIVGVPRLHLRVASSKPLAAVAARLCEVDREGRSWLVAYGVLNLCFRNGFDAKPSPLEPAKTNDVLLELNPIAYRLKASSTLRLSLSDGLWPLAWPSPERATLTFDLAGCALHLPIRPIPQQEASFPIALRNTSFARGEPRLDVLEQTDGTAKINGRWPESVHTIVETGTELSGSGPDMELFCDPLEPTRSRWHVTQTSRYRRGDWDCEIRVEIAMTSTRSHFQIEDTLTALKDGKPFFSRTRRDEIPRRFG